MKNMTKNMIMKYMSEGEKNLQPFRSSNPGPSDYSSNALPAKLSGHHCHIFPAYMRVISKSCPGGLRNLFSKRHSPGYHTVCKMSQGKKNV